MSEAEAESGSRAGREEVWIEKYRPQRLDEIVGQEDIVERLQSYVDRNDLSHMLFSGPAGIGKCVTGETPILTNRGLSQIEDIIGETDGFERNRDGLEVLTLTDSGEFEYASPSHQFSKTANELVSIRTRDGGEMAVTPEHRLLVVTDRGFEWIEAGDIKHGDRVVRPLSAPLPGTDEELDWLQQMDGDETFAHVTESFAREHEIPIELDHVGTKRSIVAALRESDSVDEAVDDVDASRKYVLDVARQVGDTALDDVSTVCPLSFLRQLDVSEDELRRNVEEIQRVSPVNNSRSPPISPPSELTPELAQFVGLAISEARIERTRIKFYNTDDGLLDQFEDAARSLFDVDPVRGTQHDVPYVEINNGTLTRFLNSCFDVFSSERSQEGQPIGSTLLRAGDESRRAFLRAVFDAEGHVTKQGVLELTQKDGDLVTLLSYLLAGFGVPSRRKRKQKTPTNGSQTEREYHALYVSGSSALSRFRDEVGFSMDTKCERLDAATDGPGNPNHDTVPVQQAVDTLCESLHLSKSELVTETLNPESPGRENYEEDLKRVLDASTEKIEQTQQVMERVSRIETDLTATDRAPMVWEKTRPALEPLEIRRSVATETGIGMSRLLEYSDGRRVPYAQRAERLVELVGSEDELPETGAVQETLRDAVETLAVSYEHVADGTHLRGQDVQNLLERDDHELGSFPRFTTVASRLEEVAVAMLSSDVLESLRTLDLLVESSLYFDEVTNAERVECSKRVYDFTVPETRNYVAGAVPTVMHNTTSATAIARELYGDDWGENFLELNASDERGIDVVRDRIKSFARTSFGGYDYRIIFLDEADALTSDAQSALRRTMEQFSNNVRFILSCNYSSQIIDPIQSRCAVFRFSPLSDAAVAEEMRHIAEAEGIELTDDGVDALVYAADGDMRKAINALQAASVTGDVVDEEAVYALTSTARPEEIKEMVVEALDGDFTAARSTLDRLLTEEGIAGGDVIDQLHRSVWEFDLEEEATVRLLDRIGETEYRITTGANERIQLEALLASIALDD